MLSGMNVLPVSRSDLKIRIKGVENRPDKALQSVKHRKNYNKGHSSYHYTCNRDRRDHIYCISRFFREEIPFCYIEDSFTFICLLKPVTRFLIYELKRDQKYSVILQKGRISDNITEE